MLVSSQWIERNLFGSHDWYPHRMGPERIIFSVRLEGPLLSLCIDPIDVPKGWVPRMGQSFTASFFERLEPVVRKHGSSLMFATMPDSAYMCLHWHEPLQPAAWGLNLLYWFERIEAEEGGAQELILVLEEGEGVIIFTRFSEFKISYHGDDGLWARIFGALYS